MAIGQHPMTISQNDIGYQPLSLPTAISQNDAKHGHQPNQHGLRPNSTAISPHDAKHGHQPSRGNATPKGSALQLQTGTGTIVMVQFRDGTLATEDMCLARNVACTAISPNDARPLQDRYPYAP